MADLPPRLEAWCRDAKGGDERTVVVRLHATADLESAEADLRAAGARVESAGPGAIVAVVSADRLASVAALTWVRAVEEPRALQSKLLRP
jgi:hypothetical protein